MNRPPDAAEPAAAAQSADWSRRQLAVLAAITALAGVLRLWRIELWPLSPFEAGSWAAAIGWSSGDWQPDRSLASSALSFLLTTGLVPAHGEGWLRLPFAFLGIVTVPLVALVGRRLLRVEAALFGAALLAVHPAHVQWSQTVSVASLACLLSLGGWAALLWLPARQRAWGLAVLTVAFVCQPLRGDGEQPVLAMRLPTLAIAAAGAWWWPRGHAHRALLVACAFVPVAVAGLLRTVVPLGSGAAAVALVPLVWLAALASIELGRRVHAAVMAWQPDALPWAAAVPTALLGALVVADALTGTWLRATVFSGGRPDTRAAAAVVLHELDGRPVQVAGDDVLPALAYYMQPSRRGPAADALRLAPLGGPGAEQPDFVVAAPAAAAALRADPDYELLFVVEHPSVHPDRTLLVLRKRERR